MGPVTSLLAPPSRSSESGFWEKLHHEFGDTDVTLSDWQHDAELGMVRSLEFVRHLGRVAMGPDKTRCSQTQRCAGCWEAQRLLVTRVPDITAPARVTQVPAVPDG